MKQKPDLSFWKLWNLSFGFLQRWVLIHTT